MLSASPIPDSKRIATLDMEVVPRIDETISLQDLTQSPATWTPYKIVDVEYYTDGTGLQEVELSVTEVVY